MINAFIMLSSRKIRKSPQRIKKNLPYVNSFNWDGRKYPSGQNDWVKCDKNSLNVAFIVLYLNEMEICPVYVSKYNMFSRNQIILLMICDRELLRFMAVTKFSALLRGATAKNNDNFYCLNYLQFLRTKNKFKCYRKLFENFFFVEL